MEFTGKAPSASYVCAIEVFTTIPNVFYLFRISLYPNNNNVNVMTADIPPTCKDYAGPAQVIRTAISGPDDLNNRTYIFRPKERDGRYSLLSYKCTVKLTPNSLRISNQIIPILRFSESYKALPYTFHILEDPNHYSFNKVCEEYLTKVSVDKKEIVKEIVKKVEKPTPDFIYKSLMEGALYRKDTCPITLETFTIENICITRCMHCFDVGGLLDVRVNLTSCPICREKMEKRDVVVYKAR